MNPKEDILMIVLGMYCTEEGHEGHVRHEVHE